MNAIPDNTLRLSQGETDNGPVYHANTGLDPLSLCPATGSPQTALARNLEEAVNINAEPTAPRASIPQNGDLRHTSLWPDKSHELMRIKDEQLEPNPAHPP